MTRYQRRLRAVLDDPNDAASLASMARLHEDQLGRAVVGSMAGGGYVIPLAPALATDLLALACEVMSKGWPTSWPGGSLAGVLAARAGALTLRLPQDVLGILRFCGLAERCLPGRSLGALPLVVGMLSDMADLLELGG